MIRHRQSGIFGLNLVCQLLLATAWFWLQYALFANFYFPDKSVGSYPSYYVLAMVALTVEGLGRSSLTTNVLNLRRLAILRISLNQIVSVIVVMMLYLVGAKDQLVSRLFLFTFLSSLFALLLLSNLLFPRWLAKLYFRGKSSQRTLLVGPVAKLGQVMSWLRTKEPIGLEICGVVTDEVQGLSPAQFPLLGTMPDLERVVREKDIHQILVLQLPQDAETPRHLIQLCERLGLRMILLSDLAERFGHPLIYQEDDGLQYFTLREEPLESPLNRFSKRILDILVSTLVVLLVLPFTTLLVWILHRIYSPGPLFFRQTRAGYQNKPFTIFKYRTMHVTNPDESKQAVRNDSRVFPGGSFVRKFSIDEMPQFLNVLLGDMSVVGPRPHMIEHNHKFAKILHNYHVRTLAKPGITGLAQVRGFRGEAINDAVLAERIRSDIHYIENWSLPLDVWIIIRTAWQVMFPPATAY